MTLPQLAAHMRQRSAEWPDTTRRSVERVAGQLERARTNQQKLESLDATAALRRIGDGPHAAGCVRFAELAIIVARWIELE